jgi:hypothetical protein
MRRNLAGSFGAVRQARRQAQVQRLRFHYPCTPLRESTTAKDPVTGQQNWDAQA